MLFQWNFVSKIARTVRPIVFLFFLWALQVLCLFGYLFNIFNIIVDAAGWFFNEPLDLKRCLQAESWEKLYGPDCCGPELESGDKTDSSRIALGDSRIPGNLTTTILFGWDHIGLFLLSLSKTRQHFFSLTSNVLTPSVSQLLFTSTSCLLMFYPFSTLLFYSGMKKFLPPSCFLFRCIFITLKRFRSSNKC